MLSRLSFHSSRRWLIPQVSATAAKSFSSSGAAWVPGIGKGKTSTGLFLSSHPQNNDKNTKALLQALKDVNQTLLNKAKEGLIGQSPYCTNVTTVSRYRLDVLEDAKHDAQKVIQSIQLGTLEELIQQGHAELERMEQHIILARNAKN